VEEEGEQHDRHLKRQDECRRAHIRAQSWIKNIGPMSFYFSMDS
jgi:hypothetical protein